jgi:AraC-type transcriptional regulator N-terminus
LISIVGLPIISQIDVASPKEPYLGLRLVLDPAVVTSTMVESGFAQRQNDSVKAIAVSKLDSDLLNACLRLLLQLPEQYRVLGPLVIREIIYRLLTGEQSHRMRHLATIGGHAHRMVRAVRKLREDFAKPLRIEEVAREIGMSVSGFHAHFKAVTAMSPLQFQKELRLQEARRSCSPKVSMRPRQGFRSVMTTLRTSAASTNAILAILLSATSSTCES